MKKRFAVCSLAAALLMLSACGQQTKTEPQSPPPVDNGGVHLNWDALTPYEAPKNQYTRRYADYTDHLIAADDYGTLIPFPGKRIYTQWMGDTWLYGLVTAQGEVVVDPVYCDALILQQYDSELGRTVSTPYLLLQKLNYDPDTEKELWDVAVAALDGSWVREGYTRFYGSSGELLVLGTADGHMEVVNSDGTVRWNKSYVELELPDYITEYGEVLDISGGTVCYWDDYDSPDRTIYYLDIATGTVTKRIGGAIAWSFSDGLAAAWQEINGAMLYGYVDRTGEWVIEPQYTEADAFHNGMTIVKLQDQSQALIGETGNILLHCASGELFSIQSSDGTTLYLQVEDIGMRSLGEFNSASQYRVIAAYDADLQPQAVPAAGETILRHYNAYWLDPGESLWQDGTLTVGSAGGEVTLALPTTYTPYDTMQTESGTVLQLVNDTDESYSSAFYNSKGKLCIEVGRYSWISEKADLITGENFLLGHYPDSVGYDIFDSTGKLLLSLPDTEWYPQLCSGLVLVQDLYGTGLRTLSGDWVFRYLVLDTDM